MDQEVGLFYFVFIALNFLVFWNVLEERFK